MLDVVLDDVKQYEELRKRERRADVDDVGEDEMRGMVGGDDEGMLTVVWFVLATSIFNLSHAVAI